MGVTSAPSPPPFPLATSSARTWTSLPPGLMGPVARVSLDILTRHRSSLQALLAELPHLLPDLPPDRPLTGPHPGSRL